MTFLERAKSAHSRGDAAAAAVILVQGLKRDPDEIEALQWLLDVYVDEIHNPGMEADLVKVLALQRDGHFLLSMVQRSLQEVAAHEKLKALDKALAVGPPITAPPPPPPPPPAPAPEPPPPEPQSEFRPNRQAPRVEPRQERWDSFRNPMDEPHRLPAAASVSFDAAPAAAPLAASAGAPGGVPTWLWASLGGGAVVAVVAFAAFKMGAGTAGDINVQWTAPTEPAAGTPQPTPPAPAVSGTESPGMAAGSGQPQPPDGSQP